MNENEEGVTAADRFLELYRREWKILVSSRALGTLEERRWNAPANLPVHEDVQRTASVLEEELDQARVQLQQTPTIQSYVNLARATLATVMLFNRRRPGGNRKIDSGDLRKTEPICQQRHHRTPVQAGTGAMHGTDTRHCQGQAGNWCTHASDSKNG